jgi:hypothetical protein
MALDFQPKMTYSRDWIILAAAACAALVVWGVLPDMVVVFNDDFGYCRSVVATLQHGRPWTDDWLEPWAASLSLVSGFIFMITGSFYLATYGLQILTTALSFWAMATLFVRRSMPVLLAMTAAVVILFSPTLMVKALEYTALVLYLPCLLLALYLAEKRQWIGFFLVWIFAVASRQSALAWLALPAFAAFESFRSGSGKDRRAALVPALVCIIGVGVYALIGRLMNETHAQHVMTTAMWYSLSAVPALKHFALGVAIFLTSAGGGAFAVRAFGPQFDQRKSVGSVWTRVWCFAAASVVLGLLILDPRTFFAFDHQFYSGGMGLIYLGIICTVGAAGWILGGFRLQPSYVAFAVGSALMVSLRGVVYDYYLIDVALIGIFSVVPTGLCTGESSRQARRSFLFLPALGGIACITLACFEVNFAGKEQRILDRYAAVIRLCEPELRHGRITPSELSVAPFGYYGWHVYSYFMAQDGANGCYIGDFEKYLAWDSLSVSFTPFHGRGLTANAKVQQDVLASGIFPVGWRGPFLFILRRTGQPKAPSWTIDPQLYRIEPFPLNDAEWRQLIEGTLR